MTHDSKCSSKSGHSRDDGHHGFAEHDDEERAESLGDVRDHDSVALERRPGPRGDKEVGDHRDTPQHVAIWTGHEDREEPECGRGGVPDEVYLREPVALPDDVVPGAQVQGEQQHAQDHVSGGETDCSTPAVHRLADVHRDRRDCQHRARLSEAEDQVVRVEAVGVERVENPRPYDHHEQSREAREPGSRGFARQRAPELADRSDEHKVEEQLEPGCVALLVRLSRRAQPWRLEPERPAGAEIPLAGRWRIGSSRPGFGARQTGAPSRSGSL